MGKKKLKDFIVRINQIFGVHFVSIELALLISKLIVIEFKLRWVDDVEILCRYPIIHFFLLSCANMQSGKSHSHIRSLCAANLIFYAFIYIFRATQQLFLLICMSNADIKIALKNCRFFFEIFISYLVINAGPTSLSKLQWFWVLNQSNYYYATVSAFEN